MRVCWVGLWLLALVGCAVGEDGVAPGPDASVGDAQVAVEYAAHSYLSLPHPEDPEREMGVADPHVIRVGGTWYLYGTGTGEDLHVWASEDLASWRCEGLVWAPTPGSWNDEGGIWAPHVEAGDDGRFYLYYTANLRIGVAVADEPVGPFVEVYPEHPFVGDGYGGVGDGVWESAGSEPDLEECAIDAFVLRASDGSLTFYYVGYTPLSTLFGHTMVDYVTLAQGPATMLLSPEPMSWEGLVREGPWLTEHEGRFILSYSGNGAEFNAYALGFAVGDGPLGPFARDPDNPWFAARDEAGIWGPGHHSFAPGARGDHLMFYHSKLAPERGWARNTRYVPVTWDTNGLHPVP